jgi:hypothetical protein
MTIIFPNASRSFDEERNGVRFIAYDGMFEVPFLVEAGALGDVHALRTHASRRSMPPAHPYGPPRSGFIEAVAQPFTLSKPQISHDARPPSRTLRFLHARSLFSIVSCFGVDCAYVCCIDLCLSNFVLARKRAFGDLLLSKSI